MLMQCLPQQPLTNFLLLMLHKSQLGQTGQFCIQLSDDQKQKNYLEKLLPHSLPYLQSLQMYLNKVDQICFVFLIFTQLGGVKLGFTAKQRSCTYSWKQHEIGMKVRIPQKKKTKTKHAAVENSKLGWKLDFSFSFSLLEMYGYHLSGKK